jgi:hypothetical protein
LNLLEEIRSSSSVSFSSTPRNEDGEDDINSNESDESNDDEIDDDNDENHPNAIENEN